MKDVAGKIAVITGAASGVGLHLALRLARAGSKIVLADIEAASLDAALERVKAAGGEAIAHVADVTKRDQIDALRDRSFDVFGKVHMVFNNAGVGGGGGASLWDTPEKSYRWMMDVNYFGPLNGILSFMPRLIAQDEEALMTVTSSAAGIVVAQTAPAYSASKAAVIALMEVLAMQLQSTKSKIKGAILFPGPHVVDTQLFASHRNLQSDYYDEKFEKGRNVHNMGDFQTLMTKIIGAPVETTSPEEFAEDAYHAILRDEFFILPLNADTKAAIRDRCERMLHRPDPV